jgi:tetrahydromethanopterin S-methyltransferase subunit G
LPCDPVDRDAEHNRLKALVEKLANKVNALEDTPRVRLGAVVGRVDEVALYGVCLGTALGLAAMSTLTGVDYSTQPPSFDGGAPEDLDDIEATVERLDGHGAAIPDSIHPQSVLNRLFY